MKRLPIWQISDEIQSALSTHNRLILSAPPGTGKSTQVPQMLYPESGSAYVLQPRRIAARSLAQRVAQERGEKLGESIGYQVRFESMVSPQTRLFFATYGIFWQRILRDPMLLDIDLVILDEFHERSLEADACLAWLCQLQQQRPELRFAVMSATLEGDALRTYLDNPPYLTVETPSYPVEITYQSPRPQEPIWEQALRGLRHLMSSGLDGSALVFMPGVGEVRRTVETLASLATQTGYTLLELSGSQTIEAQQRVLTLPEQEPCLIVSTNVAETSLTIPGVTAVIDSGLSRQAAYDSERDLDTLHLLSISRHNAIQRAGRAGRLSPGRCLRLWPSSHDSGMPEALPPEIERLDLSGLALAIASLPSPVTFLTPPPSDRWESSKKRLIALGAIATDGQITSLGQRLLRYPLSPALAYVLDAAREKGLATLAAAMIALFETDDRQRDTGDLYALALDYLRIDDRRHHQLKEAFRQLCRLAQASARDREHSQRFYPLDSSEEYERRKKITSIWLEAYRHRLAFRHHRAYELHDGQKATLTSGECDSELLIALRLHEVGGVGKNRRITIPLYLPCHPDWLPTGEPTIICQWDETRRRLTQERHWKQGALTVKREILHPDQWDWHLAESQLTQMLLRGEVKLACWDEDIDQLVWRIRLAAKHWPERNIPQLDEGDWEILYHTLCHRRSSPDDVKKEELIELIREYIGWETWQAIEQAAPRSWPLPSGKKARIIYFEESPPELSARLGDMIGLSGTMNLLDGRVQVLFDILAPNYRTVQKTWDMTGFWQNTYPEVKKELKRRYPKHPWP